MVYCGENVLVIESIADAACRVLLSSEDLLVLQKLECVISESVTKKSNIVQPVVRLKFNTLVGYI